MKTIQGMFKGLVHVELEFQKEKRENMAKAYLKRQYQQFYKMVKERFRKA